MPHTLKLIADVAIVDADERVLLVRYADTNSYDHQAGWFLPDDALRDREHPDAAARCILDTQLGWPEERVRLEHIESFVGNSGNWHMVFHYRVDVAPAAALAPSIDLAEACWFPLDALPPRQDVAHHGWALRILKTMIASDRVNVAS